MSKLNPEEIKSAVRRHYAQRATSTATECCSTGEHCEQSTASLEGDVPPEALRLSAGCASPIGNADVREGETVLDLGSGGGIDVFRASKLVGPRGRVIGVDTTPEMIAKARQTAQESGFENVEFRLGEIEHLPLESNIVDLIVSNCVINLAIDKQAVFTEALRVLKPGGRFVVADVVALEPIPDRLKMDPEAWSSCISGALEEDEYVTSLKRAGFTGVRWLQRTPTSERYNADVRLSNNIISASKPFGN
jgi:arsenite methyltransferase